MDLVLAFHVVKSLTCPEKVLGGHTDALAKAYSSPLVKYITGLRPSAQLVCLSKKWQPIHLSCYNETDLGNVRS